MVVAMVNYGQNSTPGELALGISCNEGEGVAEDPPGSNRGSRVDVYLRACKLDPARGRYPWCAAHVTWAIREACLRIGPLKFRGSASVANMLARNSALVIEPGKVIQQGDVLLHISPEGNHCGFFVRSFPDGRVYSREGNTDDAGGRTGGRLMNKARPGSYWTHALRTA